MTATHTVKNLKFGRLDMGDENMNMYSRNAMAMRSAQAAYDNAQPEETPETPCFKAEIDKLMSVKDTHTISFEQFKEVAEDNLYECMPEGLIELLLACFESTDPELVERTVGVRKEFEQLAAEMLENEWWDSVEKYRIGDSDEY